MQRRRRVNPKEDAKFYVINGRDKVGLDVKYINAFKGRGIFTTAPFAKGDFLLEYRGELISKQTSERRMRIYHDRLKVFMFEFQFNGTLWCVDAASEDGSLGRLVNDDHINPNAKMKYLTVDGKPHLCLFAIRDINPGEEITYNYGDSDWPWRCEKPGGMSTEGQHGEVPHTSEPSKSAKKMITEENPIQTAEGNQIQKTEENPIQTDEGNQIQTTEENPIQTDEGNQILTTEENPIQTAEENQIQTTKENPIQTDEGNQILTTEENQIQTTEENPTQTSAVLGPLDRVGKVMTEKNQIQMTEENSIQTAEGNQIPIVEKNPIQTAEGNQIQIAEESKIQTAEGNQTQIAEESKIQTTEENQTSSVLGPLGRAGKVQIMTETNQIQTTEENLIQTSSVLGPLGRVGKVMTEKNQIQMTEENPIQTAEGNQTSSVLGPLGRVGKIMTEKNQIQMTEGNQIQTTEENQIQTAEGNQIQTTEENQIQTTEGNQIQMTEGNQIQPAEENKVHLSRDKKMTTENNQNQFTSPSEMDPVVNSGKCQNHRLVCTTVSSLDKCIQCIGPVSSFKWLGYKCKVCSGIWHKSCFRRITNNNFHHPTQEQQLSKYSGNKPLSDQESASNSELDQISDDLENVSDEDYIPDSESQNEDNEDSDASIPFLDNQMKAKQIHIKPVIPDDGTSYGSDTSISVVHSTTLEDHMVSSAAETSESSNSIKKLSKVKPQDGAEHNNQESAHLTTSNKNYCYICGKPQSKISRHLRTHTTDAEIVHAFTLPECSKERKILLEKMRNKGNFKHNTAVLQGGTGSLKVKRRPKAKAVGARFIHCMYCQGMFLRKELWRHVRRCSCKPENEELTKEPGRTKVLGLAAALESASCHQISSGVWKLLTAMKQDEVASVVRNDFSIIQFAQSLYNKHGQDPTKYEYMRQKLREVGRLLLCLRTEFSVHNMEEAVKPANFQRVVQAVKNVSGFDEEKHSYATPSLALKLGHTLHKICDIVHCRALMAEDEELIKSTDIFKKLYSSKWSELVSHSALNTLSDAKYNKPSTLPFTEDVQILHRYLEKSAANAFSNLKEEATSQNYAQLAKVTLAQIIVFNRRRAGEVSKMRLRSFYERDNTKLHEDVAMGLSKTEQRLCNYFTRVEIMGKRGRKVAVLLTPSMVDALSLLTSKRTECGVCETNVFLFARPKSVTNYRGQDCLRVHANQCGAKHPEYLRSTQLRKHVATLSQVLNLKNNELDQVADFLGHDIRVHRDFYRLPVPTTQLAKISKLLLSMEKGHLSSLQGKSLDEIEIEDEIPLSDTEAKDSESESEDCGTAFRASECGTSDPVDAPSDSITDQVHDINDFGTVPCVTSTVTETDPLSEEQDAGQEHESRRRPKKPWSKTEVAAVMRYFRDHISKGKLATKIECSHCKLVEGPVLEQRTVQNIRDFVRNRGIAAKRQSQKQKL